MSDKRRVSGVRLLTKPKLGEPGSNAFAKSAGNKVRGGKRPAPGMAWAERARDGSFFNFPI
ncbi:hypothetical protein IBT54_002444 [Pantoea sp. S62]|nr:hypothetical protein [Pantoea sp. S62]